MNSSNHKQKTFKRRLADWLQRSAALRWGLETLVTLLIPRHHVGAVGVVFNSTGQILLVEHVFRPNYNWGLPGGWVERGENPASAVRRELEEELGLKIEVKSLLACETQGREPQGSTPVSLGLAYYCRLVNNEPNPNTRYDFEILSTAWVDPVAITHKLTPLDHQVIALAQAEFERLKNA
jgi:ADP-ribose pyrophosphatase YjhB (NUDIX family)